MAHLIDKSAVVAKIEKIREYANENWDVEEVKGIDKFIDKLESYINTLEVKDVDLEKEIQDHIKECLDVKFPTTDIELIKKDVAYTANKFFELGIRQVVNESIIRKIVDLNNEAAKYYDAVIKKEREENGFSQLAIDLFDHNVDINKLRIQYIIENLRAQKGEKYDTARNSR